MLDGLTTAPGYSGWELTHRASLLVALRATGVASRHEVLDCEHVTYQYPDYGPAPDLRGVWVVGVAADDRVQALVVEAAGTTTRPDGRIFHITYTLAPGVEPVESNDLLRRSAWGPFTPIRVPVQAFWRALCELTDSVGAAR